MTALEAVARALATDAFRVRDDDEGSRDNVGLWVEWRWEAFCGPARAALAALNLTEAAADALASGEAVVVPRVATDEMMDAATGEPSALHALSDIYDAMLAASPYLVKG